MDISYIITPFVAWILAGTSKFIINSIKAKQLAFGLIGYGGLPSNHSSIVSSAAVIIALKEGLNHPALVVAIALAFVTMLDANSLRRQVGKHATIINRLNASGREAKLRERMGHTKLEILAGIITGFLAALIVFIATDLYVTTI